MRLLNGDSPPSTLGTALLLAGMFVVLPAVVAGLLGVVLSGQILHTSRFRAYATGAILPVLAMAGMLMTWTLPSLFEDELSFGSSVVELIGILPLYMVYGLFYTGWIIIPLGWFTTWWLRRRYPVAYAQATIE
jgi:hypothetical protein